MALRSMASDAQRQQWAAVQKEFTVNGSALAVSVLEGAQVEGGGKSSRQRASLSPRDSVTDIGRHLSVRSQEGCGVLGVKESNHL